MSDYESMQKAEAIIAAADRGEYDAQLGIAPDERELLNRAEGDGPLSAADVTALSTANRPDLIDAAYLAGRINLDPTTDQEN